MADRSQPLARRRRVLATVLLAVAAAELAATVVIPPLNGITWAVAVGSFTVTNGAMGLGFAACGMLLAWRWPIWAAVADGVLFALSTAAPGSTEFGRRRVTPDLVVPDYHHLAALWTAGNLGFPVILALAIASLAVRYRRGGDAERRQLLWLVLACLVVLAYAGLWWGLTGTGPILGLLVIPLIPVAVTIAILRYQLLDIRLVFSRTVAYAIVTGVLAGLYIGLVLLATEALPFSGPVAVAVSTLACAALFTPLRRRTQRIVDRRFNRARYDTDQAIAVFAGRLRDAVDLDAVSADLAAAVQAALEPAHLSVWISRPPDRSFRM